MLKKSIAFLAVSVLIMLPPLAGSAADQAQGNLDIALSGKTYGNIKTPMDISTGSEPGSINLKKGQPLSEGVSLESAGRLKDMSPTQLLKESSTEVDLGKLPLGELKFLKTTPLESVVAANPQIANLTAAEVGWKDQGVKTLNQLASTSLGKYPLPVAVLENNSVASFGDIKNTPISAYENASKQPIANFMGASDVPLSRVSQMTTTPALGKVIAQIRVDRINTKEYANGVNHRITSGSNKEPHAPCTKEKNNCSLLEIQNDSKISGVIGSMWMVDQKLKGGTGLTGEFATAAGIREYAGYEIPGTDFKVVAISSDARKGTAQLRLDMKLNSFTGSTPYFIPLIPLNVSEKEGLVFLPVEIAPVTSTKAKALASFKPATEVAPGAPLPIQPPADQAPLTEDTTKQLVSDNVLKGNLGPAVKSNAVNPSMEGG